MGLVSSHVSPEWDAPPCCRRHLPTEPKGFDLHLSDTELLHFTRQGHRERIHDPYVLRNLEVRDLPPAVLAHLVRRERGVRLRTDPRCHHLTQIEIRQPHYRHIRDLRVFE